MSRLSRHPSRQATPWQRLFALLCLCVMLCGVQAVGLRHAVAHAAPSWQVGAAQTEAAHDDGLKVSHHCAALDAATLATALAATAPMLAPPLARFNAPQSSTFTSAPRLTLQAFAARAPPLHPHAV